MKLPVLLFFNIGSVTAFAPSRLAGCDTLLKVSADLEGMVGASVETGGAIWDPLNVSDYVPVQYARAAELANGRVAMLAVVGWLWPKYVGHFEGSVTVDDPIAAVGQSSLQWWAQFVALCGCFELYKYQQELNGKTATPNIGGGTPVYDIMEIYPSDEAKRVDMELKELKNGRLAMLAIAGFVAAHYIPGSVPWVPL